MGNGRARLDAPRAPTPLRLERDGCACLARAQRVSDYAALLSFLAEGRPGVQARALQRSPGLADGAANRRAPCPRARRCRVLRPACTR
jgi:hypothetical protein